MKRFLLILSLCLSAFVLNTVCVVSTKPNVVLAVTEVMNVPPSIDSDINGERPSPTDPDIDGDRPYQNEDTTDFPNPNPDIGYKPIKENELNNDSNSNIWLYVGIGAGVVALAVGSVFVVRAIKRKKQQW